MGNSQVIRAKSRTSFSWQQFSYLVPACRIEKPYALQISAKTAGAIKKGDVLLATFWARAIGAEEARTEFVLELARAAAPMCAASSATMKSPRRPAKTIVAKAALPREGGRVEMQIR